MRSILIYRPIGNDENNHFLAEQFVSELGWAEHDRDVTEILIRFNSPGGSVFDGFAIISKMQETDLIINGIVDGLAASMAAFIALSCDKLVMNVNAKLMLHLPQVGMSGDAEALRATADKLDNLKEQFAGIIAKKAGITSKKATELYLKPGTDTWLTAKEAKAAGLCDEITGEITDSIPTTATAGELHKIYAQLIDTTNKNKMDKQKFIGLLGTQARAEMTDDEIYAAVKSALETATAQAGEITALKAQVSAFETAKAEAQTAEITALLTEAVEAKKITAEQKAAWASMFDKDFENAKALLNGLTAVPSIADVPKPGDNDSTTAELVAAWNKADRAGTLEKIKTEKPEDFKVMYKARWGKEY